MPRARTIAATLLPLAWLSMARGGEPPEPTTTPPVSFLKDVAPVLVRNCVACHNPKKSEGQYDLTTFAKLARGGQQGNAIEPGEPDASKLVELVRHDGQSRMPYKQDPLPSSQADLIARWVEEGARYDGDGPEEDWVTLRHRTAPVVIPDRYPVALPISALAFSPDGSRIATSGYHEINLWRVSDGTLAARLRGLPERVHAIAYSTDGRWLATVGGDPGQSGSARLWKARPDGTAESARELVEGPDVVFAVAFSPDGRRVAAAGADRVIRAWEVESGKLLAAIEDHADWIFALAFSPDGRRIASASRDRTSRVFDLDSKATLATFSGHAEAVHAVAFTPDGKLVVTGGADNRIRTWDPADDGKQVSVSGGFDGAVFQLGFFPGGRRLVACSADGTARFFDDSSPGPILRGHRDWVQTTALSPDGKAIATGGWDGEVRLWDPTSGAPVRRFLAAPRGLAESAGR